MRGRNVMARYCPKCDKLYWKAEQSSYRYCPWDGTHTELALK